MLISGTIGSSGVRTLFMLLLSNTEIEIGTAATEASLVYLLALCSYHQA